MVNEKDREKIFNNTNRKQGKKQMTRCMLKRSYISGDDLNDDMLRGKMNISIKFLYIDLCSFFSKFQLDEYSIELHNRHLLLI